MTGQDFKQRLLKEQDSLQDLIKLAKENAAAVELDQSKVGRLSRMDALQKQAMSQEVDRRRHIELTRIITALARIEDDEFGFCITCGNEIGEERLNLNPSLPQCTQCAAGQ